MNNKYLVFTGMGFELIGVILVCIYIGRELDQKYQLQGLALAGLSMLGLAGWIFHIVVLAKKLEKNNPN